MLSLYVETMKEKRSKRQMESTENQEHREWKQNQDPIICYLQIIHFKYNDTDRLKLKECKKVNYVNTNPNKAEVGTEIADKVGFRKRNSISDKRTLCHDKGVNSPKTQNNPKWITGEYTIFSISHETFPNRNYILAYKNISNFKIIKVYSQCNVWAK